MGADTTPAPRGLLVGSRLTEPTADLCCSKADVFDSFSS